MTHRRARSIPAIYTRLMVYGYTCHGSLLLAFQLSFPLSHLSAISGQENTLSLIFTLSDLDRCFLVSEGEVIVGKYRPLSGNALTASPLDGCKFLFCKFACSQCLFKSQVTSKDQCDLHFLCILLNDLIIAKYKVCILPQLGRMRENGFSNVI